MLMLNIIMPSRRFLGIIGVVSVIIVLAAGFLYMNDGLYDSNEESITTTTTTTDNEPLLGVVVEFDVESREFSFDVSTITVKIGDTVRINLTNAGAARHNFGVGDFGVRTQTISGGNSETIEFIADRTGTFNFDCSVPGHRNQGMLGNIIIE